MAKINPKELIRTLSVEDLCDTAESFFATLKEGNPLVHMGKPFSDLNGASDTLQNMSHLLSELQLGKAMTVLDFAAGACWLSRFLTQLQCQTISCDVSESALSMGQDLFARFPPVGGEMYEPKFLKFNGRSLDLPSEPVDRIVCHDGLHHIPNQEEVFSELARVLKHGGIAGFSEPGRFHSQSEESQHDMREFNVLENDIVLSEIFAIAQNSGFTDIKIKPISNTTISLQDYKQLTSKKRRPSSEKAITKHIRHLLDYRLVFFLYKGDFVSDSRQPLGLSHSISAQSGDLTVKAGDEINLLLKISNTGQAKWISEQSGPNVGVVFIGIQLYDRSTGLLNRDFSRFRLEKHVSPGESIRQDITIRIEEAGSVELFVDLVSEQVCWFEDLGSEPLKLQVRVLDN